MPVYWGCPMVFVGSLASMRPVRLLLRARTVSTLENCEQQCPRSSEGRIVVY